MTCAEFRHHNDQPIIALLAITRGLRSALFQHFYECGACQRYVNDNFAAEQVSGEIGHQLDAMKEADMADPEFYQPVEIKLPERILKRVKP